MVVLYLLAMILLSSRKGEIMRKDNLILSLWMLLVLLMLLSSCDERKEDFQPKSAVNWNTVEETDTEEQELRCSEGIPPETENIPKIELQASYKMDANGNLVKVYEKEP